MIFFSSQILKTGTLTCHSPRLNFKQDKARLHRANWCLKRFLLFTAELDLRKFSICLHPLKCLIKLSLKPVLEDSNNKAFPKIRISTWDKFQCLHLHLPELLGSKLLSFHRPTRMYMSMERPFLDSLTASTPMLHTKVSEDSIINNLRELSSQRSGRAD
jgi:hypothetical protein